MKVLKVILKIIWILLVITAFVLSLYFLLNGGWDDIVSLTRDSGSFFKGFAQFWVNFWEGIKALFAK